ncbi:MAG: hypothetical protein QXK08_03160 [Candidatus Woesearchaeota archaeon]
MIFLCTLFAALLAPVAGRALGGQTEEERRRWKKFGAILGIIIGISAAFALRAAGITLLQYWLVPVVAALLLGAALYSLLVFLHVNPLFAATICIILGWFGVSSWYWTFSKSDIVRNVFGWSSLLALLILLIFLLWRVIRRRAAPPAEEPRREPTPPTPGTPPAGEPPTPGTPPAGARDAIRDAGDAAGRGGRAADALEHEGEEGEEGADAARAAANAARSAAERDDMDEFCNQLERLMRHITAQLECIRNMRQPAQEIMSLRPRMLRATQEYDRFIRDVQLSIARAIADFTTRINRLRSPARTELEGRLRLLNRDVAPLNRLSEITRHLNTHLNNLNDTEIRGRYEDAVRLATRLQRSFEPLARADCRHLTREAADALRAEAESILNEINRELTTMQEAFRQIVELARRHRIWARDIRAEIQEWGRTYQTIVDRTLRVVIEQINTISAMIATAEGRPAPEPIMPPTQRRIGRRPQPEPEARREALPPREEAPPPSPEAPTPPVNYAEMFNTVRQQRNALSGLVQNATRLTNALTFQSMPNTTTRENVSEHVRTAITAARTRSRTFTVYNTQEHDALVQRMLDQVQAVRNQADTAMSGLAADAPQRAYLTQAIGYLDSFHGCAPILHGMPNTETAITEWVMTALRNRRPLVVTNTSIKRILRGVCTDLNAPVQHLRNAENALGRLIPSRERFRPRR